MDKQNNNSKCKQCQKCPPSQTATRHCKPIHNRECGCPPGTYHDKEVLICLECLKCNVGCGAVSPCTNISNTECQPCREVRVTRLDNLSIVIQLFCFLRRRWTFTGNSALLPSYATNFCDIACSEIAPCGENGLILNPFTPKISWVILLTVCHTIIMTLGRRIWYWIN